MIEPTVEKVLARFPFRGQLELHLRRRTTGGLPPLVELVQYNTADGVYRQACPFPDEPGLLLAIGAELTRLGQEKTDG